MQVNSIRNYQQNRQQNFGQKVPTITLLELETGKFLSNDLKLRYKGLGLLLNYTPYEIEQNVHLGSKALSLFGEFAHKVLESPTNVEVLEKLQKKAREIEDFFVNHKTPPSINDVVDSIWARSYNEPSTPNVLLKKVFHAIYKIKNDLAKYKVPSSEEIDNVVKSSVKELDETLKAEILEKVQTAASERKIFNDSIDAVVNPIIKELGEEMDIAV